MKVLFHSLMVSVVLLGTLSGFGSVAADKTDLRILFVGNNDDRGHEFTEFLKDHFIKVEHVRRDGFHPATANEFDVVLLDWSQRETNNSNNGMAALQSPLGDRESWNKPTVLLGSAGLLLAKVWEINSSYG